MYLTPLSQTCKFYTIAPVRLSNNSMKDALSRRYSTSWVCQGEHLGYGEAGVGYAHGDYFAPQSILYVCSDCGSPWAFIRVSDTRESWMVHMRSCPRHGPAPLLPYRNNYWLQVPERVLKRELEVITKMQNSNYYTQLLVFGKE